MPQLGNYDNFVKLDVHVFYRKSFTVIFFMLTWFDKTFKPLIVHCKVTGSTHLPANLFFETCHKA